MTQAGYVYFIQRESDGFIRVGKTRALDKRMAALQHEQGCKMTLLGVMSGYTTLELQLHKKFRKYQSRNAAGNKLNEWFSPVSELLDFITANAKPYSPDGITELSGNIIPFRAEQNSAFYEELDRLSENFFVNALRFRAGRGWTQTDIATQLNLAQTQWSLWEKGEKTRLQPGFVLMVCRIFNVDIETMFEEPPLFWRNAEDMLKRAGDRIREERAKRGWSIYELARRSGLNYSWFSYVERNERVPRFDTAICVARAFEMPLEELLKPLEQPQAASLPDVLPFDDTPTPPAAIEEAAS